MDKATRPTSSSCRAKQAFNLLTAIGTLVPARMEIQTHESGDPLEPTVTYRARFEKVPEKERDDGRRLLLHLNRSVSFGLSHQLMLVQVHTLALNAALNVKESISKTIELVDCFTHELFNGGWEVNKPP